MPQPDGLVHGRGEDKVVLGPRHIQQVGRVAGVLNKRPIHENLVALVLRRHLIGNDVFVRVGRAGAGLDVVGVVAVPHLVEVVKRALQNPNSQNSILELATVIAKVSTPRGTIFY